jgi:hypothetical protein
MLMVPLRDAKRISKPRAKIGGSAVGWRRRWRKLLKGRWF